MTADPKQGKRIVDQQASFRALLLYPFCAACGARASNAHHVIQKGAPHFGDDVVENMVGLCGTGTSGCHGAIHGSPYTVTKAHPVGNANYLERRDAAWVGRQVGGTILRSRPDVMRYVLGKLGEGPGEFYLRRFYYIETVEPGRLPV